MTKLNGRTLLDFQKRMLAWYARHKRAMPWRGTRDAYRVWVSEIMLQQTRVAAVLPYYQRFVKRFPTVQSLARARREEVLRLWAGLGYYSRARNLHSTAREIVAKHGGKFPREHAAALALPGVGRYTAAAVLSIAYGEPLAVLDGNVARVLARLAGMRGDLRAAGRWKKLEERAQELMESGGWRVASGEKKQKAKTEKRNSKNEKQERHYRSRRDAGATQPGEWNQAMMELGATVCTPRGPRCGECPVARWCKARELGIAEELPDSRKKRAQERIEIAAAVMVDARGQTLLVKPVSAETNGLFSRMWQFPAVEVREDAGAELRQHLSALNNSAQNKLIALAAVKHSVTYREVTLRPFLARVKELPQTHGARAVALEKVERIAVSSATRKIARAAEGAVQARSMRA